MNCNKKIGSKIGWSRGGRKKNWNIGDDFGEEGWKEGVNKIEIAFRREGWKEGGRQINQNEEGREGINCAV